MKRGSDRRLVATLIAASGLAAAWLAPTAALAADATTAPFGSRAEAEAYLARAVPAATQANPKYRSPGSDALRRWLTKSAEFHDSGDGAVVVSTNETFEDYRDGSLSGRGTHEATFAIDDVRVSVETAPDLTESGEPALGVLFSCAGAPCIEAVWDGQKSMAAETDIYIQDAAQRERILAAFEALRR
jgi:hypothetical protein